MTTLNTTDENRLMWSPQEGNRIKFKPDVDEGALRNQLREAYLTLHGDRADPAVDRLDMLVSTLVMYFGWYVHYTHAPYALRNVCSLSLPASPRAGLSTRALMTTLAPYLTEDSYVTFHYGDGGQARWYFDGKGNVWEAARRPFVLLPDMPRDVKTVTPELAMALAALPDPLAMELRNLVREYGNHSYVAGQLSPGFHAKARQTEAHAAADRIDADLNALLGVLPIRDR